MNPKIPFRTDAAKKCGMRALMAATALSMLLASGCTMMPQEEEALAPPLKVPEKVTYETLEVKKGIIERKLRATGRFMSVAQANVQFTEQGGRLETIHVKIGQKVKKGDVLATLDTQALGDDTRLQEIALERAQLGYDKLNAQYEATRTSTDPTAAPAEQKNRLLQAKFDLDLARLDVESARIRLESLRRALAESQLLSPIDGDVTYVTNLKTGDHVETYATVVTVADPTKLQLRYADDRVGDFSTGMQVTVTVDRVDYRGEVVMTPVDLPVDAKEELKETVLIAVEGLPEGIRIGQDAQILAILERREDTVVLPKYALNKNFGRTYVNVLKNNIREERDVEVGIQSETEFEVIKGLELGESVIVR